MAERWNSSENKAKKGRKKPAQVYLHRLYEK
jgi:hypothetical protein